LALGAVKALLMNKFQIKILNMLVDPCKISLDIGAHYGVMTYFLAKKSKHVYAYEPNAECFDFMVQSAASNVSVICKGVSDQIGDREFYIACLDNIDCSGMGSFHRYTLPRIAKEHNVRVIKTTFIDNEGYSDVGFIKIDTEGHEINVINGALALINSEKPNLMVEIRKENADLINYIMELGYNGYVMKDNSLETITFPVEKPGDYIFLDQNKRPLVYNLS
jgi:FkbM family methyltransferase